MYQKGDKVVILGNGSYHNYKVGEIATIHHIHKDGLWLDLHNTILYQTLKIEDVRPLEDVTNRNVKHLLKEEY